MDGHEVVFMAALLREIWRRQGAGNTESIILNEFFYEHFSSLYPHWFMRDRILNLVEIGLLKTDGQTVHLTQNGIDHCNSNVQRNLQVYNI